MTHRSIIIDVLMYRFSKVTICLGFASRVTILDIFMLIIDYQDDRPFETGGHLVLLQRNANTS